MPTPREQFRQDGFYLTPPVIPAELIERVIPHMDAVMMGEYETGTPPYGRLWNPGDDPDKIRKIDDAHLSDHTIYELFTHPEIGRWAAKLMNAHKIQLWAAQMLYKPPGGEPSGHVGWHQDTQYWKYWQEGSELFTAWIAIGEVTENMGAMRFVRGSHRWGNLEGGSFFDPDHEAQQKAIQIPPEAIWEETAAVLPSGAISFHHNYTLHGSGSNISDRPRRSFALHLRTERSQPVEDTDAYYVTHLDDQALRPVIYNTE
jgi:ectoine hydroxylase-related dioxygenase (phytanoyl-CoA dioxygenase family)